MALYLPVDYANELPSGFSDWSFGLLTSCPNPDLPMRDLSDPRIAELYKYKPTYVLLVTVVYPCFCIVGLLANGAFLFSVARVRYMRTLTNIYLCNLAVADIWFLITGTSFSLWKFLATPVTSDFSLAGGPLGCFLFAHFNITPFEASTLFVTLVSFERYLAICRPVYHRRINSKSRTIKLVVGVWLIANVLSLLLCPSGMEYLVTCVSWPQQPSYRDYPTTIASCIARDKHGLHIMAFIIYAAPYCVQFPLAAFVFYKIVKTLDRRRELTQGQGNIAPRPEPSGTASDQVSSVRNRVAIMLIITGVTSFVLNTPRFIVNVMAYVQLFAKSVGILSREQQFIVYVTVNLLLYVNSVVNPFIYALSNPRYRAAVYQAFCAPCVTRMRQPSSSIRTGQSPRLINIVTTGRLDDDGTQSTRL